MIAYLDSSALVKLYVAEAGSKETAEIVKRADILGTSVISRVEVAAALAKAVRAGVLSAGAARKAEQVFAAQWADLASIPVTEGLLSRAEGLAWSYTLRGFDAVHLACALIWRESVGMEVTLVTFDHQLSEAGEKAGLEVWPVI